MCAAVSIPAARPLMTGIPLAASPVANWRAWWIPRGVGWRVPTTTTEVTGGLLETVRLRRLEQRALGRWLPGSSGLDTAALFELLGHR